MYPLRQNTAITIPIFCHDSSGDPVLSLSDGDFSKRIAKENLASGNFGDLSTTIAEKEYGWYDLPLSATDTNTNGILTIHVRHASIMQVNLQYKVFTRGDFDRLAYTTEENRPMDVEPTGTIGIDLDTTHGPLVKDVDITGFGELTDERMIALAELTAANIPAHVDTLLARISAVRAVYFDNLSAGAVALASVCSEPRLAELAAANIPDHIDTLLTRLPGALTFTGGNVHANVQATADIDFSATQIATMAAEIGDALATDTVSQPGQEAPAAAQTIAKMLAFLYKEWRNRSTTSTSEHDLMDDAGTTVDQRHSVADVADVYTKGEYQSGP